jgi:pimeloyl-ACP methyl ester carboxylesterase
MKLSAPSRRVFTTPDGVKLAGDLYGAAGSPLVVMTHGGGQSRSSWRGTARALADAGYHVCSMDLRGHGESDWAPDGDYSFDRYVDDLAVVIAELGGPAILVGASLGGHVALIAAARRPDLVEALLLADVTPWIDESVGDEKREAMRRAVSGFATIEEASQSVNELGHAPPRADHARLKAHMRVGEDGRLFWRWDPRFVADEFLRHGGNDGLFADEARKLAVPVLLMRAEFSTITLEEQVRAFQATVPWLQTAVIAGAHHMVTGDVNDAYATAILDFVGALAPADGGGS